MSDMISSTMLYGNLPTTVAELRSRIADLSHFYQPIDADNVEEKTPELQVTAEGEYPVSAIQNWWGALIATLSTYSGAGSRSLVSRRLMRMQWIRLPELVHVHQQGVEAFRVSAVVVIFKMIGEPPISAKG